MLWFRKSKFGKYPQNGAITWERASISILGNRADNLIIQYRNDKKPVTVSVRDFIKFLIQRFKIDNIPQSELKKMMTEYEFESFDEVRALYFVLCFADNYRSFPNSFGNTTRSYAEDLIKIAYSLDESRAYMILMKSDI